MRKNSFELAFNCLNESAEYGVLHKTAQNIGENIDIKGVKLKNFSICDYLGLSLDDRIKNGAIQAIQNFGVYTAVSHGYLQLNLYEEAEEILSKIFEKPVAIFPRTTLTHIGVLPVIINPDDIVLLDHQVHTSVNMAAQLLASSGINLEIIRHNAVDLLESRIKELSKKYKRIWYLADGVYSMYGDTLPYHAVQTLLEKYEYFNLYVDDAHGMSWKGVNGRGALLSNMKHLPNMVVTTSLGKGFGAGGGAVVCNDQKMCNFIKTCAPPLNFTSPVSPATIGAIIESAKIHLTNEIIEKQKMLMDRISYFYKIIKEFGLPYLSDPETPISFIATGKPDMCREICLNLMHRGFYTNVSHFPAVPLNNSGIRIVINLYQRKEDILNLVIALKEEFDKSLAKRDLSVEQITKHYKLGKFNELAS